MGAFLGSVFLNPFGLAFLGLLPIVVWLYILKLRRTEVVIPSTMLWVRSLQDLTANAPFQRLRRNLLLFLQLLALACLALALARPFVEAAGSSGNNILLIIDRSASMGALENNGRTRLELAQEEARNLVNNLRGGDKMMLVAFADSAVVLSELSDDRRRLRQLIDGLAAPSGRSNLREVMLIARSLAPPNQEVEVIVPDLEIVLLSDGRLSDLDALGALGQNLRYLQIGETSNNAGITALSVRRPEGTDAGIECFALVRNAGTAPLDTTLSLYVDDTAVGVEEISVPPQDNQEIVFSLPRLDSGVLRVELDHEDALAIDDAAWLTLRPPGRVEVLLVAEEESIGAYFLRRALALDTRVSLSTVTPGDYVAAGGYDLTLFNQFSPNELPPGTQVYFDALPPVPGLAENGILEQPPVLATDSSHPLMRLLNPGNTRVQQARALTLPEGARSLISTQGGTLVADVSRGGNNIIVIGFDLANTNWPLHLSFPLFVQNLVSWVPRSGAEAEASLQSGAPLELLPEPGVSTARILRPDGREDTVELDPTRPVFYGDTSMPGPYRVNLGTRTVDYAVSLLDRNETDIAPAESIALGRTEVAAERGQLVLNYELWRWLVLAALAVLGLEWWIYARRAWM